MWILVVMTIAASVLDVGFGAAGPATSGMIVDVLAAAIMLISAPRFFKQAGQAKH
jgi:hypothetical protein